jgi:L-ascorbate metabolism protein UlaG (beta-lactamase superfamily)
MEKMNVNINYLFNSSFIVETENYLLIFDYYKDSVEKGSKNKSNGAISIDDFSTNKKILVFVSHGHEDHYNPVIFKWADKASCVKYILSSDIKLEKSHENTNIISTSEDIIIDDVYVKAYGSTDIGVSFLIKVDSVVIFHAGDLNWWYWKDDPQIEIEKAEVWYKDEVKKIKETCFDIAFFPVDPRLEEKYCLGPQYFIDKTAPKIFIPMHFGENYEITKKFAQENQKKSTKVIEITHRGQQILL